MNGVKPCPVIVSTRSKGLGRQTHKPATLVCYFECHQLNPDRISKGFRPYDHARIGYMLAKIPTKDLWALKSKMVDAQRRSSRFSTPGIVFHKEISFKRVEPGVTLK